MRGVHYLSISLVLMFLTGAISVVQAQDAELDNFSGNLLIGYRFVDVTDSEVKYDQHINLDDGIRLFEFRVDYEPVDDSRDYVDLFSLDIANFGGDPFESLDMTVRKFGKYHFGYHRHKSTYFYEDILADGSFDFHLYNFERIQDRGTFSVRVTDAAKLSLGFNRIEKQGESTTTQDIARDEFEFDKMVEQIQDDYRIALDYRFNEKFSVVLEERIREYENANSLFLPGYSDGEDTEDSAVLYNYVDNGPYDYQSFAHTVRVNASPMDRLNVLALATLENLDLDVDYNATGSGVNYDASPLTIAEEGSGSVTRDIQLYDVDLTFLLNERIALLGGVRYHNFSQDGDMVIDGAKNKGKWEYDILGVNSGLQVQFSPTIVASGGVRYETRGVKITLVEEGESEIEEPDDTTLLGAFGNLSLSLAKALRVTADYQLGSSDDPFTLTSPTTNHRLRLRTRYNFPSGIAVTGSYQLNKIENDNAGWTADSNQANLQVGYHRDNIDLSAGYGLMTVKREVDQVLTPSYGSGFDFPVLYEGKTHLINGQAHVSLNKQFAVGGNVNYFDNKESNPLSRLDLRAFVEMTLVQNYLVKLGLRHVNYEEEEGLNDYSANIGEVSIGYRW